LLLFGLMGPFAAALMNRFGIRRVVTAALLLIVAGLVGSFAVTAVWQLVLLWGVVVGIGTGMTALVLGATVATRWFTARRGLVLGLMTASNATGQLVFLPLVADVTTRFGWRAGLCLPVFVLFVAMALVLVLVRNRPSDMALLPYGDRESRHPLPPEPKHGLHELLASPLDALRDAARSRTFWILFSTFFVCGLSTNGLIQTHWIALCGDFGMEPVSAAGMLAVVGVFDLAGTILSGWLSDRYDNRWLLFWYYGLRGLSLLYLPSSDFSLYGLSLFMMFYGLDWVATVPPTVRLAADHFGRERANLVFGWIFTGHQLGAATAAFGAGVIRTVSGTYLPSLYMAGAFCILASFLVLMLSRQVGPHLRRPPGPSRQRA
jgi:MFS family permease